MEHQAVGRPPSRCFRLAYIVFLLAWFVLALLLLRLLVLEVWQDSSGQGDLDSEEMHLMPLPDMAKVGQWGEDGVGVKIELEKLHPIHRAEYQEGYQKHRINTYLSDRISMRRRLPDVRNPECREVSPTPTFDLMTASIIIVFRDQPWTVLLRTVYSVVDRSPNELVREVILVDDGSTELFLQHPRLEHYFSVLKKVRILRLSQSHGQATASNMAARQATGDVLVFLRPQCECTQGWLSPLLSRIRSDRAVTAVPLVDNVDYHTFQYVPQTLQDMNIGSFTWELKSKWRNLTLPPPSALLSQSVTVAVDGIFAIDRHYFFRQGGFDELLLAPDNQHLELSFRLSMCGGGLELVPCSHVGLVRPMDNPVKNEQQEDWDLDDRVRITEIWLDRYKDFFYERLTKYPNRLAEVLSTSQADLRENLTCRSFTWYLRKLEPNMLISQAIVRRGTLTQAIINQTVLALTTRGKEVAMQEWYLKPSTIWYLTDKGQLLTEGNRCLTVLYHPAPRPRSRHRSDQPPNKGTRLEMTFHDLNDNPSNNLELPQEQIEDLTWQEVYDQYMAPQTLEETDVQVEHSQEGRHNVRPPIAESQSEEVVVYTNYGTQVDEPEPLRFEREGLTEQGQPMLQSLNEPMSEEERQTGTGTEKVVKSQVDRPATITRSPVVRDCAKSNARDRWDYTELGLLHHQSSDLCLQAHKVTADQYVLRMVKCEPTSGAQIWTFSNWLDYVKKQLEA